MGTFSFIDTAHDGCAGCPDTVNPSLWRQSKLNAIHGLFEVVPGIYQVRNFDLSNITFIEGDTGYIVIDPLISAEPAAAALALMRKHRGDKPVTAVIYTHSHVDHYGGVYGVLSDADIERGLQIIRPKASSRKRSPKTCWPATRWAAARLICMARCCRAMRGVMSMPASARPCRWGR